MHIAVLVGVLVHGNHRGREAEYGLDVDRDTGVIDLGCGLDIAVAIHLQPLAMNGGNAVLNLLFIYQGWIGKDCCRRKKESDPTNK